jgi:RNA polymerase-binding protein DksA
MPFDSAFLSGMKGQLNSSKERLEEELARIGKRSGQDAADFTTAWEDYGDKEEENAAEVAAYSDSLGIEATLEPELAEVIEALSRLDAGTYGLCKTCGKEISRQRLQARPMATLCIECQEKSSR